MNSFKMRAWLWGACVAAFILSVFALVVLNDQMQKHKADVKKLYEQEFFHVFGIDLPVASKDQAYVADVVGFHLYQLHEAVEDAKVIARVFHSNIGASIAGSKATAEKNATRQEFEVQYAEVRYKSAIEIAKRFGFIEKKPH